VRMSNEERLMLAGELYLASDPILTAARNRARRMCREYNLTTEEQQSERDLLLQALLGKVGEGCVIEPPFACDYGEHIRLGRGVFMNFGCVLLDCNTITIGDGVLMGPGVHIYAATHPTEPAARATLRELARPVTIGRNVWLGGRSVIGPGVTIGEGNRTLATE